MLAVPCSIEIVTTRVPAALVSGSVYCGSSELKTVVVRVVLVRLLNNTRTVAAVMVVVYVTGTHSHTGASIASRLQLGTHVPLVVPFAVAVNVGLLIPGAVPSRGRVVVLVTVLVLRTVVVSSSLVVPLLVVVRGGGKYDVLVIVKVDRIRTVVVTSSLVDAAVGAGAGAGVEELLQER